MGTAASHSSEEEEEGAEEGMEAAAQPGDPFPAASPAPPLPPAEVLLEQARLREATARLREAALPESLVSRHHGALVRWLEERLSRGDEAVSLEQFCEVLESVSRLTAGSRGESEEVSGGRGGSAERGSAERPPEPGRPRPAAAARRGRRAVRQRGERVLPCPVTPRRSGSVRCLPRRCRRCGTRPAGGSSGGAAKGVCCASFYCFSLKPAVKPPSAPLWHPVARWESAPRGSVTASRAGRRDEASVVGGSVVSFQLCEGMQGADTRSTEL